MTVGINLINLILVFIQNKNMLEICCGILGKKICRNEIKYTFLLSTKTIILHQKSYLFNYPRPLLPNHLAFEASKYKNKSRGNT